MDDPMLVIGLCIGWSLWVWLLCRVFKRDMAVDAAATMLGLLLIVAAVKP